VVRATLNIKERDFAPGLSYVAVSWVKTLDGLMFEESFDLARFQNKPSKTVQLMSDYTVMALLHPVQQLLYPFTLTVWGTYDPTFRLLSNNLNTVTSADLVLSKCLHARHWRI
jgi:hypothetical protein